MAARASIEEASCSIPVKSLAGDRLVSLDAFRGLTIFLMVIVNSSGPAVYYQFHHAAWNGWTLADTVFPSFLWIVGVAITLSVAKRLAAGIPPRTILLRAVRRAVILYACGVFIYLFPAFDFARMRFTGVLQRIAICYLIAVCIYLYSGVRAQLAWTVGLLAAYWAAIMLIPVPGFGAGNLTVNGNLAHYLDHVVLGQHNWILTQTWDPEGLLSTLPAIATTLLGVLAGHILKSKPTVSGRCRWLLIAGCALLLASAVCDIWLPINKNLWTSSFALFMAGLDCAALAVLMRLIDGRGYRRWAQPFIVLGMNAIAVYMVSELLPLILIFVFSNASVGHASLEGSVDGVSVLPASVLQLLYAIIFAMAMYAFAWFLYRRKWFLRL